MRTIWKAIVCVSFLAGLSAFSANAVSAQTVAATRAIGTIQTISGVNITLKTDQGVTYAVTAQDATKVLRIEPGQTSLASASPIALTDIQVGDRVLASGNPGDAANTIVASSLVAIKKADVESKQQQDLQAWTRQGTGGIVSAVDATAGTVSLKVSSAMGPKTVTVGIAKTTQILRYSSGSVKFSDAKPSTLDTVQPGDQMLARGAKSADGNAVTADAVISGTFRNLSGTITSIDAAGNTLMLKDATTKQTFTVKVTADSQVRKLTLQAATMLAARMKAAAGGAGATGFGGGNAAGGPASQGGRGRGGFGGGGGGGDLSQVISRAPTATLADMQKGDALMVVASSGAGETDVAAIQVVAGVEPILEASPTASMNLPAWDVGGGGGGGDQ
jgi:hypothetical protein